MDEAERIARDAVSKCEAGGGGYYGADDYSTFYVDWLSAIRSYGEQCRRAGVEAMVRTFVLPSVAEAASPAAGWRPIDTAPKDGTVITLFARCKTATAPIPVFGHWDSERAEWIELTFSPNVPVGIIPLSWRPRPSFSYAPPPTSVRPAKKRGRGER